MRQFFFDVDNVILDFQPSYDKFIKEYFQDTLSVDNSKYLATIYDKELEERFFMSEQFSCLPSILSIETFNTISSKYPTYLITNIPYFAIPPRIKNLEKLNIQYTEIIPAGLHKYGKKYLTKAEVIKKHQKLNSQIYFIDDLVDNCVEVSNKLPDVKVFLQDTPYNRDISDMSWVRVKNWDDFLLYLEKEL